MKNTSGELIETGDISVRILVPKSGRGLLTDAKLLENCLVEFGMNVQQTFVEDWSINKTVRSHRYAKLKSFLPNALTNLLEKAQVQFYGLGAKRVDLQIHLESIAIEHISVGTINWLIPNQEWIRPQHLGFLKHFQKVLCKTQVAKDTMSEYHKNVELIRFSNPNINQNHNIIQDKNRYQRFLHVAGKNRKKGTQNIIDAWSKNPQWPQLHLVADDSIIVNPLPHNIKHWPNPDEDTLNRLRRIAGVVIAPSEVEGYGHVILEGMLFQSIVVTTDAAPMNELIQEDRGLLLPWTDSEQCHLGRRYFVHTDAIETKVNEILERPNNELETIARRAFDWTKYNHTLFLFALSKQIKQLLHAQRSKKMADSASMNKQAEVKL